MATPHPGPAPVALVRAHADALRTVAARYGLGDLRCAGPGLLLARVPAGVAPGDVAGFGREASALLGAEVDVVSDEALQGRRVPEGLRSAEPL